MVLRKVGVIALSLLLSLGACRKAGIAAGSGATVALAVSGSMLISDADPQSNDASTGGMLIGYAILGLVLTMTLILSPTPGETPAYASTANDDEAPETSSIAPTDPAVEPREIGDGNEYDHTGARVGSKDASGNYYDRTGARDGSIDANGNYYDRTGARSGSVDASGRVYDRTGASAGSIDDRGTLYDRTGASAGSIDANGNVYDRTGARVGSVDSTCDAECRRAAAGRILLKDQ